MRKRTTTNLFHSLENEISDQQHDTFYNIHINHERKCKNNTTLPTATPPSSITLQLDDRCAPSLDSSVQLEIKIMQEREREREREPLSFDAGATSIKS